jgi:isocitrate dehydrogenase
MRPAAFPLRTVASSFSHSGGHLPRLASASSRGPIVFGQALRVTPSFAAGAGFVQLRKMSSIKKIQVKNPVVELDGDEMTRIIWQDIKDRVSDFALLFAV